MQHNRKTYSLRDTLKPKNFFETFLENEIGLKACFSIKKVFLYLLHIQNED